LDIAFGDNVLDVARRELRRSGEHVPLAPQIFDLLVYLVRHRDRVVSKDDLVASIWGGRIVSDSALTTAINAARQAVGDSGSAQSVIRTVARRGVRFVAEVAEHDANARPVRSHRVASEPEPPPTPTRPTGSRLEPHPASPPAAGLRQIGFLGVAPRQVHDEFRRALAAYGYRDGETVQVHYCWSEGDYSRHPALLRELLDVPVEVLVASASPAVAAAKQATGTIPIVMVEVGDPVGYGFVSSLFRPNGNVTGISNNLHEYGPKALRLFKEIMPEATRVAILAPATNPGSTNAANAMEAVAQSLDMAPQVYYASTSEICVALAGLDKRTNVLVVVPDHGYMVHRTTIIDAAMAWRIPVICQLPEFVFDGALLSFDPNRTEIHRRLAYYVDALLKGAKPSELPIEEPSKHWIMLNLRTARQLGIDIPGPILMRADQVIE